MNRISVFIGLGLSLLACSHLETDFQQPVREELTFTAIQEVYQTQTKTERQVGGENDGENFWLPGDAVSLFFNSGTNGGNKFVAQNQEIARIAEFKGTIDSFAGGGENATNGYYFWAVYPYSDDVECDGESVILTLPDSQVGKVGSYSSGIFPTMAKEKGLELGFHSIGCGLKFTVGKDNIKAVKFQGNNGEKIAGKVKVIWGTDGHPEVNDYIEGKQAITVSAPNGGTFIPGAEYYIVFLPGSYSAGFSLTYFTTDGKQGTYSYTKSRTFNRNIFTGGAREWDLNVSEWTDAEGETPGSEELEEGGTESGLYFGLSTFDRNYRYYPVQLMSESSLDSYKSTIDELQLTNLNGTLLYYSCDEDITSMQGLTLPSDLTTVSLVTFTDGFDEGSTNKHLDLYDSDDEYLDYVTNRMLNETVKGIPIKSYAIGLKGTDANSDIVSFRNCLRALASSPSNQYVYEIDANEFNKLRDAFTSIAEDLSESIKLFDINVHFTLPSDEQKIRITFDIANPKTVNASSSNLYIEGIYSRKDWCLHDITYHGFSSNSGDSIQITKYDGMEVHFDFKGLQLLSSEQDITSSSTLTWKYNPDTSTWRVNTESTSGELPTVKVRKSSALVLLNLDLSHSLEGRLPDLKKYSKEFVETLYSSSVDPNEIKGVHFDKASLDLAIGQTETLQTIISPSTAAGNTLLWSSATPSVATVNQNGMVTAVSEGTTIISVSTVEGKEMAKCVVTVRFQHVENISLDKTQLQLYVGKTATLAASISPSYANNQTITWTSSNPDIATVNDNGVVTAIAEGNAIITVSSVDGNKTATCSVSVASFIPSSTPRDLTLAVSLPSGGRYFLQKDDLQYVNLDDYIVEGLYVVGISAFIVALKDASTDYVCYDAANTFFHLPDGDQGVSISARFKDINTALVSFGGNALSTYYYWTSEQGSSSSLHKCIEGSGGSLTALSNTNKCFVREVVPLSYESPWSPVTTTTGLFLSVSNGNTRQLLTTADDIPAGFLPEGLAIEAKGIRIIISLSDASSDSMTYSSAYLLYGSTLPNQNQGKLISSRFSDINRALKSYGGKALSTYYYWTSQNGSSSGTHQCIEAAGGSLTNVSDSNKCLVRLIVANNW